MDPSANPYAPPKHDELDSEPSSRSAEVAEFERVRQTHIAAETNIKGLGFLLYLASAAMLLSGLASLRISVVAGGVTALLGAGVGLSAYWLRKLDRRGRLGYTIFVGLALVAMLLDGVSAVTLPNFLGRSIWGVLFVVATWTAKASTVMTPHYREVVIPATPHIKYKTSPVVLVLLGILVVLILIGIVLGATG